MRAPQLLLLSLAAAFLCSIPAALAAESAAALAGPAPTLAVIPAPLTLENAAVAWSVIDDRTLELVAPKHTNLFNAPDGKLMLKGAPMLLFPAAPEFLLTARLSAPLTSRFDVAALVVYQDATTWVKFCYENSATRQPTIVSVVTRGLSDDCNALPAPATHAYLAVARKGSEFSLHYSEDGKSWALIRHFALELKPEARVGFAAHGAGATDLAARFSEITYAPVAPKNMRHLQLAP
ncbi:DUF1349 domain-containing protein [Opitutus sp. ER46]|uniref:DUF1349 domain-containing protein n=1 Tax=Opitutus sp. ER46 TaxID=2161864 RepID=UPI001304EA7C|nr:DUF1349 domain-containing protein [Opitutus sp. ER46]